ncbi:hypothetical protein ACIBPB_27165 [Micromonospora sp. NPDC049836]|uniref:hypothetical protein n=1 Tax=Micromonospora sp. NPDC049836 TaxID=3364274 RepID=UPI0037B809D0
MFRELGLPSDEDWATLPYHKRDKALRECLKGLAADALQQMENLISLDAPLSQAQRDHALFIQVIEEMAAARLRLDEELLLVVGQAEEMGLTWTVLAAALGTSTQNAHKVFAKRLMGVRNRVASGWKVEEVLEEFYRRRS